MRFIACCVCFLVAVAWVNPAEPVPVQKGSALKKLMTKKLQYAQRLLEGIALGDFDKISKSAEELIQVSKTAEWYAFKTPKYKLFSAEFRRASENIIAKAKAKNVDGTALAYLDLTMSCVGCHSYVREIREARADTESSLLALLRSRQKHH